MGIILSLHFGNYPSFIIVDDWAHVLKFLTTLDTLDDADVVRVKYAARM